MLNLISDCLRVFESRELRKIYGPKRREVRRLQKVP